MRWNRRSSRDGTVDVGMAWSLGMLVPGGTNLGFGRTFYTQVQNKHPWAYLLRRKHPEAFLAFRGAKETPAGVSHYAIFPTKLTCFSAFKRLKSLMPEAHMGFEYGFLYMFWRKQLAPKGTTSNLEFVVFLAFLILQVPRSGKKNTISTRTHWNNFHLLPLQRSLQGIPSGPC